MRKLSTGLAAALLAAAALPGVAAAPLPTRPTRNQPVPVWRRPKRDPLAAERDAHNAAIDARKAEKRERQAARRAQTGSVALEMAVLAFVVVAALLVAAWVGRA